MTTNKYGWKYERWGFQRSGMCWRFFAAPRLIEYYGGDIVWFSWWRFYIVFSRGI